MVGVTIPFDTAKPVEFAKQLIAAMSSSGDIVVDFFAGSGTTAHAVMMQNVLDDGNRRYILVQLPEPIDSMNSNQKAVADFCAKLGKPYSIAELTKECLRCAVNMIREKCPSFAGDLAFRLFKLDSSNIREWEPIPDDLDAALLDGIEHIKPDRYEQDTLYELLLKLGLDLCVPMETRIVAGKSVHAIGAGALMTCLDEKITRGDAEPLALGIADWHKELAPAGKTTVIFRDSAFADDVVKTNLAAILEQRGFGNVRSL